MNDVGEILAASLGRSPRAMLKAALEACIRLSGADGGSILAEEGPHLQFLFSNVEKLIGMKVPQSSIAGACLMSGRVIYTHAPSDKRHFDGVDSGLGRRTEYLLSIPIPSALPETGQGIRKAGGVLQLLYARDIMTGRHEGKLPAEYALAELFDGSDSALPAMIPLLLPVVAFGMEVMRLRQTSYQVIHELKNKMISGLSWINCINADLLDKFPDALADDAIKDDFEIAESSIREGAELAKGYLQFTKLYTSDFQPADINVVLKETAASARALAAELGGNPVEVVFRPCPAPVLKPLDQGQLKMAFFNLCKNAVEAMSAGLGGTLEINADCDAGRIGICIRDNGPGMPPEIAENLFVPFKTKKEGGTGLGLTIAKKIIDIHGGVIKCASGPGGTEFSVLL